MFYKPRYSTSHTQEKTGALLKEACIEWNIAHKEPALVTDNTAQNMIAAGVEAEMTPHLL